MKFFTTVQSCINQSPCKDPNLDSREACADTGFPHGHWKDHFQVGHRKESEQVSFSDSDQDSPGAL